MRNPYKVYSTAQRSWSECVPDGVRGDPLMLYLTSDHHFEALGKGFSELTEIFSGVALLQSG